VEGTGRIFGYGSNNLSGFPETRLDDRHVMGPHAFPGLSVGSGAGCPVQHPRTGGLFLCTPNGSLRGAGSWAGMPLTLRGIQRRQRICSRLFMETEGLFGLEWSAPTCRLLPGLGVCSLCANTGDVFAAAAPCSALPHRAQVGFFPIPVLEEGSGGGIALFLSSLCDWGPQFKKVEELL